ncbi:hypothetical protein Y032_0446g1610 [Ancylostoma ceylanicum]|uniref:SXP/RAL-2 family protein Ani s 5-like cation-binding domain-containing protein n=1 Tax=Ancylostoma ceylanicum TaxID=53326 RepID=A0A016WYJ7_9BILA|nr:hypothetical protein Y032_0446g1610 [Ancylostoma ceylanicum]
MFQIILLCTVLGNILARPLSNNRQVAASLTEAPDTVVTDEQVGAWVEVIKTMRDTSLSKEKRAEKISQLLAGNWNAPPEYVKNLVEASDYEWRLVNNASSKVKEVYNKSYDLKSDPKLYKMDPDKRIAEGEKLLNSLSEAEKKELAEIREKSVKKVAELRRQG